jgi:hypothetical protein
MAIMKNRKPHLKRKEKTRKNLKKQDKQSKRARPAKKSPNKKRKKKTKRLEDIEMNFRKHRPLNRKMSCLNNPIGHMHI